MKLGVSLNISILFLVAKDGGFGAGPPPFLAVSHLKLKNSFAMDYKFLNLSLTFWTVRFATLTAFTVSNFFPNLDFMFVCYAICQLALN